MWMPNQRGSDDGKVPTNACRPAGVFTGLFAHLAAQAGRGLRRKVGEAVRLIDSSSLRLAGIGTDWARFCTGVCGAKMHVVYDPDAGCPLYAAVTPARTNDIVAARAMPVAPGAHGQPPSPHSEASK